MSVNANEAQLEASFRLLVNGLVAKEFRFLTPEATPQQMHEQITKFDEERNAIVGKVFHFMIAGTDMPEIAKTITEHIVAFGTEDVDDAEVATFQQHMRSCFPLCAVAFSRGGVMRFVAIVDGDGITEPEFFEALDRFQEINLCMLQLGTRFSIKLLGKSFVMDASSATGSMIIVTSTTERANLIRKWVSSKPLHSDTFLNQMKESFTRWQFWAKAVFGFYEYKPHKLIQEAIVLDAQTGRAISTTSPRIGLEFGFALTDIACERIDINETREIIKGSSIPDPEEKPAPQQPASPKKSITMFWESIPKFWRVVFVVIALWFAYDWFLVEKSFVCQTPYGWCLTDKFKRLGSKCHCSGGTIGVIISRKEALAQRGFR